MSSEILVLGAGMVGVSTALALRQRGHHVTLVDRKAPGQETSYGNAGLIQREAVQPYAFPRDWRVLADVALGRGNDVHYQLPALLALAPRLARYWANSAPGAYAPLARAYAQLIVHCLSEHAQWVAQAGADDLVERKGWVRGFLTPAAFEAASVQARQTAQEHQLGCTLLDGAALARLMPALRGPLAGGIHWTDPWAVSDPGGLVARYAALLGRMGGETVRAEVRKLQPQGAHWQVQTDAGPLQAQHVVLALGPWADGATRALGYRLPLFVKRGYHRHYVVQQPLPMPLLLTEPGFMLAPMTRGLRITTGAEFAPHEAPASPVQLAQAERVARGLLELGEAVEPQPWLGARPCTVDMNPVIGAAPRHPGLWFNFGHGHQGFTLGPASGRLLAELISGEAPYIDPKPYSPQRF
ncbi:FAD-binding oxidoreductase [Xenophilus arseniciresistens]|uniref:FAD-binding oxidoreductase n=1 Tax=Xenophilus arseniciresistens TaxID=1283306 RepID=A0AAE3T0H4_9BURK|nr:FAD-binding oxidoreductase [Xenophilus arseniciresistens]MDA7416332.1 FAD-binding oxidoreductase [Xenophilus arseniciresistens]